MKQRSFWSW